MNYRKAKILARESATTAATKTLDIDLVEPVSRFQIRFEPINNGNSPTAHPAKCVSKVELVDGSDVLMSLSGMEAQALDYYDTGQGREYEMDMRNDMPNQEFFNLNFGRKLWDPQLAFDPKKFSNPQLKITHDRSLGGSAPDAAYLTVYADVFDEKAITPIGWLMAKEFNTRTSVAGAYNEVDLPKDYPLRKLLFQALLAGYTFTDNIDDLRIDENNQKKLPFDGGIYEFITGIFKKYPLFKEIIAHTMPQAAANNYLYVTPGEYVSVVIGALGSATTYVNASGGGGRSTIYTSAVAECRSMVTGYMPHGVLPVEFGDPMEIEDWYDITKVGSLKVRTHEVQSAVTVNLILQQLRKYA
jgi:hypothetical protein